MCLPSFDHNREFVLEFVNRQRVSPELAAGSPAMPDVSAELEGLTRQLLSADLAERSNAAAGYRALIVWIRDLSRLPGWIDGDLLGGPIECGVEFEMMSSDLALTDPAIYTGSSATLRNTCVRCHPKYGSRVAVHQGMVRLRRC